MPVIEQVEALKLDPEHQERDHEDAVSRFFEHLGYRRGKDIKFRRGRVDILIEKEERPLIVIEVKRDWALTKDSKDYVRQAFNYAAENGARYVIVTNSDHYVLYDRKRGLSYEDQFVASFELSRLSTDGLATIFTLRAGELQH